MSKLTSLADAVRVLVPDGASVAMGLQMEQMIPFAAGHEIMRQRKKDLRLIGPISDVLFDQVIGAGCVKDVVAAWVGNVAGGSGYGFRRAFEQGLPRAIAMEDHSNFTVGLALKAAAMGLPFLPTLTGIGGDIIKDHPRIRSMPDPFGGPEVMAVAALKPDVAIIHVQRADAQGNAHCWGNYGVMPAGVRAAKKVIVTCEEIVAPEVIASDPNRTVIPGFLVSAVVECPFGAHPSPVQGYYKRDDAAFQQYHEESKTPEQFDAWAERWVYGVRDRAEYVDRLGGRADELRVKQHAYAAQADFGY